MKYCPKCGKQYPDQAIQCPKCKCALPTPPPIMPQQPANPVLAQQAFQQQQMAMMQQQIQLQQQALALQQQQMAAQAHCPRCGSTSLSAHKKGFGVGKAVVGAAIAAPLAWPIGLVAGNIGAKKVRVTCLNCGKQFKA